MEGTRVGGSSMAELYAKEIESKTRLQSRLPSQDIMSYSHINGTASSFAEPPQTAAIRSGIETPGTGSEVSR